MHSKRFFTLLVATLVSGAAMAHPGAPGHVHPELTTAQQIAHAAMSWAPVVGLAIIAAWGVRRAARDKA